MVATFFALRKWSLKYRMRVLFRICIQNTVFSKNYEQYLANTEVYKAAERFNPILKSMQNSKNAINHKTLTFSCGFFSTCPLGTFYKVVPQKALQYLFLTSDSVNWHLLLRRNFHNVVINNLVSFKT